MIFVLGFKTKRVNSPDLDSEGLGFGVPGRIRDGECVRGGFGRGVVYAAGVRRPDGIRLWLELDSFGVRDAVAELDRLAAANLAGTGVEGLNRKLLPAHLFEGSLILGALLCCCCLFGAVFDRTVLPPAGEENPENDESGNRQD